jgi:hypothetical protein
MTFILFLYLTLVTAHVTSGPRGAIVQDGFSSLVTTGHGEDGCSTDSLRRVLVHIYNHSIEKKETL